MAGARFPTDERFGGLREYVLSLELALPRGEIVRSGSRAVKDVTGYNLAGFVMGGGGRCGMIARSTLRLLPRPFAEEAGDAAGAREASGADKREAAAARARPTAPAPAGTEVPSEFTRGEPLDAMAERIYEVFDPARIMLP